MSPDPAMNWKRLGVTALGLGTAASIASKIQTSWFTSAAGINPAYLKLILGYLGINYGDRLGKNIFGENMGDFGAGVFLDGARDLVVQYVVPQLMSWMGGATTTVSTAGEYGSLVRKYFAEPSDTYHGMGAKLG